MQVDVHGVDAPVAGADAAELEKFLARIWDGRVDRYSDERAGLLATGESRAKIEMSYIGG